jgi:HK97 family phage prohead protease
MPPLRLDSTVTLETRDAEDGTPLTHFSGLAVPYNTTIEVMGGREVFKRGAFAQMVRDVKGGERLAYLTRHGINGGEIAGVVDELREDADGLHFGGNLLENPHAQYARDAISAGITGVSVEVIPGVWTMKGDVREHRSDVRLAAIAGSYAPAYREARVALRDAHTPQRKGVKFAMPPMSIEALTERRDALTSQVDTIRSLAEGEGRELDSEERDSITALEGRRTNIEALILSAQAEAQRRDAERSGSVGASGQATITRQESIYGPHQEHSWVFDLTRMALNHDSAAAERMTRHRALVTDLAVKLEKRSIESNELAGAFPTGYYPDLYVPDTTYNGPFASFFAETPIAAPVPIIVPSFSAVTGDTGVQATENTALANVDVATAAINVTPKTIGGEAIVSRQAVDGASPGTDVIVANELRELLMRDKEREIALVLEALTSSGAIADTAGTAAAQSGRDLHRGIAQVLAQYYAGAAAGGAGARFLPAEGWFSNSTNWNKLIAGEDINNGRPLLAYINPVNTQGQVMAPGFQRGIIGGVPVEPAWSILAATNEIVARKADARQWISPLIDVRLNERNGPQSVVFAVMQYFAFAVLQPKGVRRYTYTDA